MASKKVFGASRKHLDTSSSSFHQSMNGSLSSSLNLSMKTPHETPSRKHTKTPSSKNVNNTSRKNGNNSTKAKTPGGGDRFIAEKPNYDMAHYLLQQQAEVNNSKANDSSSSATTNTNTNNDSSKRNENSLYSRSLTENMLGVSDLAGTRVLSFTKKPKFAPEGYQNALKVVYQGTSTSQVQPIYNYRVVPKSAERVLDAPDITDDFYLNVLEWSKNNVVGIALKDQVYLWTAHTAAIQRLPCDVESGIEIVTSLTFLQNGSHVITSLDKGVSQVWDIDRVKIVRTLRTDEPQARIAAVGAHNHLLVEGNRLGTLRYHDLRVQKHEVACIRKAHSQEICGVRWSPDGRFCATGGNDNFVHVWDSANISSNAIPVCSFSDHLAAVKALCWSPSHHCVLATGGGTNDRTIKIWNVSSSRMLKTVDVESQVSGIIWHEGYREILSSHGFTKHHIASWKYPEMTKVGEMTGHSLRILAMAMSPDETTVVTVSADETLRFWRVFPPTKTTAAAKKKAEPSSLSSLQFLR